MALIATELGTTFTLLSKLLSVIVTVPYFFPSRVAYPYLVVIGAIFGSEEVHFTPWFLASEGATFASRYISSPFSTIVALSIMSMEVTCIKSKKVTV